MKLIITGLILFSLTICYSQVSLIDDKEMGRYMNTSLTNYEVREVVLFEDQISFNSLNGVENRYKIIERNKSIIKAELDGHYRFFELKRKKIIVYQRSSYTEATIEGYKNGDHLEKNVFRRIN